MHVHIAGDFDLHFGSISSSIALTRLCLIARDVTSPAKLKAAVRTPVPIVYNMMRSIIEAVRVKGT